MNSPNIRIIGIYCLCLTTTVVTASSKTQMPIQSYYSIDLSIPNNNPFELLYFEVVRNGYEVMIIWDAKNEFEVVGYQIERAIEGGEFESVGWEYSREISREMFYEFNDGDVIPSHAPYFYRLKIVHFDGSIHYSPVTLALRLIQ